ncbi:unnamed protein product [Medioppia subpectinata]|uniref:Uncharacterized protein n=1 Tax=Medioppia subpectinata TaxID=1979941 RepID=A0A7R9L372_9ACAR|nr:unnamed protein product [Medioppia subpectinata]CAG2114407.1 unnamed protein product [Medioppia subpectinata]
MWPTIAELTPKCWPMCCKDWVFRAKNSTNLGDKRRRHRLVSLPIDSRNR